MNEEGPIRERGRLLKRKQYEGKKQESVEHAGNKLSGKHRNKVTVKREKAVNWENKPPGQLWRKRAVAHSRHGS